MIDLISLVCLSSARSSVQYLAVLMLNATSQIRSTEFQCDVRASFAIAFGAWRRVKRVPLKKIARDLGVSIGTVSAWELGRRFPAADNFQLLVEYTGLPPCRLLCVKAEQCVPSRCLLAINRLQG